MVGEIIGLIGRIEGWAEALRLVSLISERVVKTKLMFRRGSVCMTSLMLQLFL